MAWRHRVRAGRSAAADQAGPGPIAATHVGVLGVLVADPLGRADDEANRPYMLYDVAVVGTPVIEVDEGKHSEHGYREKARARR